jgi:branched-chain amino acid transport system permease protein
MTARAIIAGLAVLAALLVAPLVVDGHVLSILIVALFLAAAGQAWNVMMGFAGQLSLGHALYVGLGAYCSAALFVHLGIGPWPGMLAAIVVCVAAAAAIGVLAFRFGVAGVYFALLTIAFAEFTRIGFDHFSWVGGSGGLFLPVAQRAHDDLWALRGQPAMFYYVLLAYGAAVLALCRALLHGRIGFYWRAVREDPAAAEALGVDLFRAKMQAVMLSAALTAPVGVLHAFYYNNLFPEQIFSINRSIELILGPIIGGIGTLAGPIIGAFALTFLGEGLNAVMSAIGLDLPGTKHVFYGLCLLAVVIWLPDGIWPPLARRLGLGGRS